MAEPRFDPSQAVKFDFGRGSVQVRGSVGNILVPADALAQLCQSAGEEAQRDFGRRLGTEAGRRIAERLSPVDQTSIDGLLDHLGGELALMGLGSLGLERWGRALVLTVDGSPLAGDGDALLAAVLEGALQRATSRDSTLVRLERKDGLVRMLVAGEKTANTVRGWLSGGTKWSEALERLHASASRGDA